MIYIYDRVLQPFETEIKRYGAHYTLDNRTRMGEQTFYTFKSPGRESLMLVPRFAEQYREVEKLCARFSYCKKLETCCGHIRREVNRRITTEQFPNEESATGTMTVITAEYKDIKAEFHYMNGRLTLSPEFEIISNNLFGNGVVVLMNLNMED